MNTVACGTCGGPLLHINDICLNCLPGGLPNGPGYEARKSAAERNRCLAIVESVRTSPEWAGQHADWICRAISEGIRTQK